MAGFFKPEGLDDPEVCNLTDDEHRAWVIFCLEPHPRCGIFQLNLRLWSMHCRTPMDKLTACLDTYERLGWIKRDEGGYVWIFNYTRHQSKQLQWLSGAKTEAQRLLSITPLAQMWLDMYGDIELISNLKSTPKSGPISESILRPTGQDSTGQDTTGQKPLLPLADISPLEASILKELKDIPTHPFDYKKDLANIRTLTVDFPGVDLLETVKTMALWLDRKPREKSSRLRLRNFCKTAAKDAPGADLLGYAERTVK